MYSVITEPVSGTFATSTVTHWHKILGPNGLSFQAYLNVEEAHKIAKDLNQQPYFDHVAFCKAIRERKNA